MNTQRILLLSYLVLGLLLGLVLEQLLVSLSGIGPMSFLGRSEFDIENFFGKIIAFAAAIGLGLYLWNQARVKTLSTEVVDELLRVSWPSRAETVAATWAVIGATLVCSIILGAFDYAWALVTAQVYSP